MTWDDGSLWEGAREGKLSLRRCAGCATLCHPPLPMCPRCRSLEWTPHHSPGEGIVRDWLVSTHPTRADAPARIVAVVELEEGVRVVSNLVDTPLDRIGETMRVSLCFGRDDGGAAIPQFRPA